MATGWTTEAPEWFRRLVTALDTNVHPYLDTVIVRRADLRLALAEMPILTGGVAAAGPVTMPREPPDSPGSSRRRGSAGNFEEMNAEILGGPIRLPEGFG